MNAVIKSLRKAGVEVHNRRQWGSPQQKAGAYKRRRKTHPMAVTKARYHFLHITVTRDTDTVAEGAAGMRQVETYGYSTPPMVSYQWCTTNEGRVFEGQNLRVKGTHTVNDKQIVGYPRDLNAYGYAVALLQNVGDEVTDEQVRVTAMTFAAMELAGFTEIGAPILPHRMFAAKSCPGDKAMARIDEIRALKDKYVAEGLPGGKKYPRIRAFLSAKTRKKRLAALRGVTDKAGCVHAQAWLDAEADRVAANRTIKQAKARKKAARKALRKIAKG